MIEAFFRLLKQRIYARLRIYYKLFTLTFQAFELPFTESRRSEVLKQWGQLEQAGSV